MQWPSNNVPQGGVFHTSKVTYSPETRDFLKTLINESKMTTLQRNKISYSLRSGDPLPPISNYHNKPKKNSYEVVIRPGSSKRRTYDSIKKSGAYERDRYKPSHISLDRDAEKQALADRMAYGNEVQPKPSKLKVTKRSESFINRYDQIKLEIKEREDWLREMEALGAAEKHRLMIKQQIEERLREMEKLKIADHD